MINKFINHYYSISCEATEKAKAGGKQQRQDRGAEFKLNKETFGVGGFRGGRGGYRGYNRRGYNNGGGYRGGNQGGENYRGGRGGGYRGGQGGGNYRGGGEGGKLKLDIDIREEPCILRFIDFSSRIH